MRSRKVETDDTASHMSYQQADASALPERDPNSAANRDDEYVTGKQAAWKGMTRHPTEAERDNPRCLGREGMPKKLVILTVRPKRDDKLQASQWFLKSY